MKKRYLRFALLALGLAGNASAAERPAMIPPIKGESSMLRMSVLAYQGGTHGELSVEVINPSSSPSEFKAHGLYFIPDENSNNAPQRLGAVGPFRIQTEGGVKSQQTLSVPASGSVKVKLDVYCIDSHRRSPTSGDTFHLAGARMPPRLSRDIAKETAKAATGHGGYASPAAKSAVQSEVWKVRDGLWLRLEGEGKQEATK